MLNSKETKYLQQAEKTTSDILSIFQRQELEICGEDIYFIESMLHLIKMYLSDKIKSEVNENETENSRQ